MLLIHVMVIHPLMFFLKLLINDDLLLAVRNPTFDHGTYGGVTNTNVGYIMN